MMTSIVQILKIVYYNLNFPALGLHIAPYLIQSLSQTSEIQRTSRRQT